MELTPTCTPTRGSTKNHERPCMCRHRSSRHQRCHPPRETKRQSFDRKAGQQQQSSASTPQPRSAESAHSDTQTGCQAHSGVSRAADADVCLAVLPWLYRLVACRRRDGERGEGGRWGGFDPTGACRRLASTVFQSADARATPRSSPHVSRPPHPSLPRRDAHLLQAEPRAVRAVSAPRSPRAPYGARRFGS